jgi:hypothetical protein
MRICIQKRYQSLRLKNKVRLGSSNTVGLRTPKVYSLLTDHKVAQLRLHLGHGVFLELNLLRISTQTGQIHRITGPVRHGEIVVGDGPPMVAQLLGDLALSLAVFGIVDCLYNVGKHPA